jgi:3-oxosteroid 1-dehydrogenase
LAHQIGVDAKCLRETTERFNGQARIGVDEDFGRGGNAFDVYYGDPRHIPNPCLAPLNRPPFYALPLWPGDIGTCGGLRIDPAGRVLGEKGPIPELYACGNTAASITGGGYPGAGGTLGPAMVFGMLAAENAAARSREAL